MPVASAIVPACSVVASADAFAHPGAAASASTGACKRADLASSIAGGQALVLYADIADWRPWLGAATALLDDAERARIARLQRPGDRDERTIAYALHRLVAAAITGWPTHVMRIGRDARGCPQLAHATTAPVARPTAAAPGPASAPAPDSLCRSVSGLSTSLTHGDGVVAMAFAAGRVGVDVEAAVRSVDMAGIADMLCHDEDPERALAADDDALLALWVRKEALLKATGRGLAIPMMTFHARPAQPLRWPDGAVGHAVVRMLDAGAALRLAVATAHGVAVDHRRLRPAAVPGGGCPAAGRSRVR